MSDLRKAAQALVDRWDTPLWKEAPHTGTFIDALRAALAQPEPEPVAWRYDEATYRPNDLRGRQWHFTLFSTRKPYADEMVQNVTPLYTAPPQRKPLTEEEIEVIRVKEEFDQWGIREGAFKYCARAIERAHGIGGEA